MLAPQPFYEDRGTPIAVHHLLTGLSQLGYQTDVLTFPMGRTPEIGGVRYFRVVNLLKIRAVPVGFSLRKIWFDSFLFFALRRRLREGDYFCIHAVEEGAFLAVLAARRFRIPVVYDMQSSLAEQMSNIRLLRNRPARAILLACERWLLKSADYIVSSAGLARLVRAAVPNARVREWRFPSPVTKVRPEQVTRLRASLKISEDQPVVLYTGTFEDYQGLSTLLAAIPAVLNDVPKAVFVLVGADKLNGNGVVQRLIRRVPQRSCRLVERQPREVIPKFLGMADVVVSPRSSGSNLPLKVLEYMAAGRAIVATSIPAHRTVLNEERSVLVEPTPSALAAGITGLLEHPARATRLQAAARAFAEKNLDWIGFVQSVGQLYGELSREDSVRIGRSPATARTHTEQHLS